MSKSLPQQSDIGVVLAALRDLELQYSSAGVPVDRIRSRARERGVSYDSTHRRLNELIESGLAVKVRRGYYLPVIWSKS